MISIFHRTIRDAIDIFMILITQAIPARYCWWNRWILANSIAEITSIVAKKKGIRWINRLIMLLSLLISICITHSSTRRRWRQCILRNSRRRESCRLLQLLRLLVLLVLLPTSRCIEWACIVVIIAISIVHRALLVILWIFCHELFRWHWVACSSYPFVIRASFKTIHIAKVTIQRWIGGRSSAAEIKLRSRCS